jgi:hypothetical protein
MGAYILKNYSFTNLTYSFFYYLIAAVLLFSGISKIINPLPFIETLKTTFKISDNIILFFAALRSIIEIGFAVLMLLRIKQNETLPEVTILFSVSRDLVIMEQS